MYSGLVVLETNTGIARARMTCNCFAAACEQPSLPPLPLVITVENGETNQVRASIALYLETLRGRFVRTKAAFCRLLLVFSRVFAFDYLTDESLVVLRWLAA